jgi:hypothetical protein
MSAHQYTLYFLVILFGVSVIGVSSIESVVVSYAPELGRELTDSVSYAVAITWVLIGCGALNVCGLWLYQWIR